MAPTWSDLGQLVQPAEVTTGSEARALEACWPEVCHPSLWAWGWFSPGLTEGPMESSLGHLVIPPWPISSLCPQLASPCQTHPLSESSPADRGTYMQSGVPYPRSSSWFPKQPTRNQEPNKGNRFIYRFGLACCSVKIHRKDEAKARKSAYTDAPPIGSESHLS